MADYEKLMAGGLFGYFAHHSKLNLDGITG
jgi:hypothetical protein